MFEKIASGLEGAESPGLLVFGDGAGFGAAGFPLLPGAEGASLVTKGRFMIEAMISAIPGACPPAP